MQLSNNHRNIVLAWLFATVAGVVLGILSVLTLVSGLALAGSSTALVGLIGGAGLGAVVGIAQWFVLSRHIPAAAWVPASILGGMIGAALGGVLSDTLRPLLTTFFGEVAHSRQSVSLFGWSQVVAGGIAGVIIGISLGAAQWVVLRRHVQRAGRWIVASGVGWMTGLSIGAGSIAVIGLPLSLLVLGGVVGAVTGGVLADLLSDSGASPQRARLS